MEWIIANAGTIIVSAILLVIVGIIVFRMIKNRKNGKYSCDGNCSCCSGNHH